MQLSAERIEWRDEFKVGDPETDSDHRQLLIMLNELSAGVSQGLGHQMCRWVLDFLLAHSDGHFRREEDAMLAARCDSYEKHKAAHACFLQAVTDLRSRAERTDVSREAAEFLHGWATNHTLREDMALAQIGCRR